MKRPGYREAILWIALNDDTEWLFDERPIPSVTASLVADLFAVSIEKVCGDLMKAVEKEK